MNDEYSAKMLKAFIGKEDKTLWYQLSFSKYTINTIPIIARIETMEQLGGTHQWVVWVYAFFVSLVLFGLVSMSIIPSLAL